MLNVALAAEPPPRQRLVLTSENVVTTLAGYLAVVRPMWTLPPSEPMLRTGPGLMPPEETESDVSS
jgi:hypothetical protein